MWQDFFRSGELLLGENSSADMPPSDGGLPLTAELILVVFVILFILQMKRFLELMPYLWDVVFRARGSAQLENSLRISHDRNLLALTFLLPSILFMYRYRLYAPSFLEGLSPNFYLLALAGVWEAYISLRAILYTLLRPRRGQEFYRLSHRVIYTCFILMMLVVLPMVGIMAFLDCNDLTIKYFILGVSFSFYLLILVRRTQFLLRFCNPLRTFLYLCALEFLPTALLVLSAVLL